jgi:hypothetical protein
VPKCTCCFAGNASRRNDPVGLLGPFASTGAKPLDDLVGPILEQVALDRARIHLALTAREWNASQVGGRRARHGGNTMSVTTMHRALYRKQRSIVGIPHAAGRRPARYV